MEGLRRIGNIQKEIRNSEDEREKEIINIQKQQTEILRRQTRISEKQTFFTELIALTSVMIGISTFIQLLKLQYTTDEMESIKPLLGFISYTILGTIFTIVVIISIIYLFKKNIRSFRENFRA
jgi:hypothetical protein